MRILKLALAVMVASTAGLHAEHFRMGVIGAAEFADQPSWCDFLSTLGENTDLFPGIYGEVLFNNFGFGGTTLMRFLHEDPGSGPRQWTFEWIASLDLRYHFLKEFILDPFIEISAGCAGAVDITGAIESSGIDGVDVLSLSLFTQVGAGLAVRLESFHVGGRFVYRLFNDPVPATDIALFPLSHFQLSLFAGVSF